MIFLHPEYLWGLLAVAIPVIIHLFRFRRYKTIYFSNIEVLKSVRSETKKQSQLKHLLVLISRVLAIIALVMIFARPVISDDNTEMNTGRKHITVYLDNSYSMQVAGTGGMLLSVARQKALALAESFSPADRFRLITNEFSPARLRFTDKATFINQVEKTGISPISRSFNDIGQRILLNEEVDNQEVFIISDFQKSTFALNNSAQQGFNYALVPVKGVNPSNLYIDSCWLTTPSMPLMQTSKLNVKIKNSGQKDFEKLPLKLKIDGKQRALSAFSIPAGGETTVTLSFLNKQNGFHRARLEISDSPVSFDNIFYFSYRIAEKIKVLEVFDDKPGPYLKRLFGSDSLIDFSQTDRLKLNLSGLKEQQLIILNALEGLASGFENALSKLQEDADILLIPHPENMEVNRKISKAIGGPDFLAIDSSSLEVVSLATKHPLMEGVFYQRMDGSEKENINLPEVKKHFVLQPDIHSDVLMRLSNGEPFLVSKSKVNSRAYTLAAPLSGSWSGFARHPVFVPVIHRMAIISDKISPLYYLPGKDNTIEVPAKEYEKQMLRLVHEETGQTSIPSLARNSQGVFIKPFIERPGHYNLMQDSLTIGVFSFNSNPLESNLATYTTDELTRLPGVRVLSDEDISRKGDGSFKNALEENKEKRNFWKLFVWLTLSFLAIEVLLLRFW